MAWVAPLRRQLGISKRQRLKRSSQDRLHPWIIGLTRLLHPLSRYHDYRVEGLEHIPPQGRAILAMSHSLATYDSLLLGLTIYERCGRLPAGLGDNLIFSIPGLACLAGATNLYRANAKNGAELLEKEVLIALAPGGMREALRPSTEKYRIRWAKRKGFVRLSIITQAPIILAACPAADDLYSVYRSILTKHGYKDFKLPVPLVRGLGPTLLPRPVKLTHVLARPLIPPPLEIPRFEEQVNEFHQRVVSVMERLMAESAPSTS